MTKGEVRNQQDNPFNQPRVPEMVELDGSWVLRWVLPMDSALIGRKPIELKTDHHTHEFVPSNHGNGITYLAPIDRAQPQTEINQEKRTA